MKLLVPFFCLVAGLLPASALTMKTPGSVLAETSAEQAGAISLLSPDGRTELFFSIIEGQPRYAVQRDGGALIRPSLLGLSIEAGEKRELSESVRLVSHSQKSVDQTWVPVWGKRSEVRDHYNEMILELHQGEDALQFFIDLRAFDDGIAIRYRLPEQAQLKEGLVIDEATEFAFASQVSGYSVRHIEAAPEKVNKLGDLSGTNTPLLVATASGTYAAIHEAGLTDFAPIRLVGSTHRDSDAAAQIKLAGPASFSTPMETPWRVVFIGDRPGAFMESDLILNLAPPCRIADTSWVQPGKAIWDRRIRKLTHDGLEYWFNTETFIRLIDFASRSNLAHLLVDSNWYGNQRSAASNPMTPAEGIDIEKVINYGKEKGVGVFLYINEKAFINHDIDEVFETYRRWGAVGIKCGFMTGKGQEKVRKTVKIVEAAARHQLMVNFHDNPIHPTGLSRTYPNYITLEYCHAQLDAIKSFQPTDFINTAMVHMLAGPMDMNNGFYALNTLQDRTTAGLDYNKNYPVVSSTIAAENARILIADTGLMVISDAPWEYEAKADMFDFIRRLPNAAWDETKVLYAELNQGVTTARRHGEDWFVGSVINEAGGARAIPLDFLEPELSYEAILYEDAADSHFQTNKEVYQVRRMTVRSGDTVTAVMAPGGGHAMVLRPIAARTE